MNPYVLKEQERKKVLYLLRIGLAGALVTMLGGDMLLMAFDTSGAEGMLGSFLSAAQQTTYTRTGLAAFFGFLGIPLSGAGYLALCLLTKEEYRSSRNCRMYRLSSCAFIAMGGGVHILCCMILTGLKKNLETGIRDNDAVMAVIRELGGALIPCLLVFTLIYSVMVIAQILLIAKHQTILPAWMAWVNPWTCKIGINLFRFLGSSALVNGISTSNMSLGCMLILLLWMSCVRKEKL